MRKRFIRLASGVAGSILMFNAVFLATAGASSYDSYEESLFTEEFTIEDEDFDDITVEPEEDAADSASDGVSEDILTEDEELLNDESSFEDSSEEILIEDASDAASQEYSEETFAEYAELTEDYTGQTSGKCGENATWNYDKSSKVLTISGSGAMWDYKATNLGSSTCTVTTPWFQYTKEIKDVKISDDITYIGSCAFVNLESNRDVFRLPSKLTGIGPNAFYHFKYDYWGGKSRGTFVIPGSLKKVSPYAFKEIRCPFQNLVIEEGVEEICEYAFYYSSFSSIKWPKSLKTVGDHAFQGSSSIREYTIPAGVKTIGKYAFEYLQGTFIITFEGDMPKMGKKAFDSNTVIAYYNPSKSGYSKEALKDAEQYFNGVTWLPINSAVSKDAGKKITWKYDSSSKTLTFTGSGDMYDYSTSNLPPWFIHADKVKYIKFDSRITSIGDYAFAHFIRGYIYDVVMPKNCTRIGERAFWDTDLSNATLPEKLEYVGKYAFTHMYLQIGSFPQNIKEIDDRAFYECGMQGLSEIRFNCIERIGDYGLDFSTYTDRIIEVDMNFPATLEYIGEYAFDKVKAKNETFSFQEGLKVIGDSAFCQGRNYTVNNAVVLPKSLESMGSYALGDVDTKELVFRSATATYSPNALGGMDKLEKIRFECECPKLHKEFFDGTLTVYYPFDSDSWMEAIPQFIYNKEKVKFEPYGDATTITFVDPYGKTVSTKSVKINEKLSAPSITLKKGDTLGGWYTSKDEQNGYTKWNFEDPVKHKMTLYAGLAYDEYRIIFRTYTDTKVPMQKVKKGSKVKEPDLLKWEGYRFMGWTTDVEGKEKFDFDKEIESDLILYAQWKVFRPIVNYYCYDLQPNDSWEGTPWMSREGKPIYFDPMTKYTSQIENEYRSFKGWFFDKEFKKPVPADYWVDKDLNVYGKWDVKTLEVTIDYRNGTPAKSLKVKYGHSLEEQENPTRKNYRFDGWYTEINGEETRFNFKWHTVITIPGMVIYAKWHAQNINVKYVIPLPDDKWEYTFYKYQLAGTELNAGTDVLNEFIVERYTFEGWYFDKTFKKPISKGYIVEDDITVYGKASMKTFTVKIDPNNGTDKPYEVQVEYGKLYQPDIPVKAGYDFAGWKYTYSDGRTGTGSYISNITSDVSAVAQWKEVASTDEIVIKGIEDMEYTGSPVTLPRFRILHGNVILNPDKCYTLKYSDNVKVGTATAAVTFKGDYHGTKTFTFNIKKANVQKAYSSGKIKVQGADTLFSYNQKEQKAKPVVTFVKGDKKEIKLKENKDYILEYKGITSDNGKARTPFKDPGKDTVIIKGIGSFDGQLEFTQRITADKPVTRLTVSGVNKSYTYTGKAISPEFVVKDGKTVIGYFQSGKFVSDSLGYVYKNNTEPGTATLEITAKDGKGYDGTLVISFEIKRISIAKARVEGIENKVFCGNWVYQENIKVYLKGSNEPLYGVDQTTYSEMSSDERKKQNYYFVCKDNLYAGTAKVVIRGVNGYEGTVTRTFKIAPCNLASPECKASITCPQEARYAKKGSRPAIAVTAFDKRLYTSDYTVTYKNNKKVGETATVTVKGKGNYTGTLTKEFKVTKADISKCTVKAKDVVFKDKVGNFVTTFAVYDADGTKLTAGKDYDKKVVYNRSGAVLDPKTDKVPLGNTMYVEVTGIGNYEGKVKGYYYFNNNAGAKKMDISKVKFTVKDYYYTGSSINPSGYNIVAKDGNRNLVFNQDFYISSYENNMHVGTGIIIIKGSGDYTGTVKVKFKIKPRDV